MAQIVGFNASKKTQNNISNAKGKYNAVGYDHTTDYDEEKSITDWDRNDFQDLYEMAEKQLGKNNAWKLIYECIRVYAKECKVLDLGSIDWNEL